MQRWARTALSGAAAEPLAASISTLQADITRVPGNFRAWSDLGYAYVTKARLTADPTFYGKAEGAFSRALETDGQTDAAQEQYAVVLATQKLYAANGQDVDTELALFEADHGDPAAAVESAQKAYAKRPDAAFTQDAYAWALHAAGRDAEAMPVARQSVRLGLKSPTLYYRLGVIEAAAGDPATAKQSLEQALALNPSFSPLHAPRAKALLESLR